MHRSVGSHGSRLPYSCALQTWTALHAATFAGALLVTACASDVPETAEHTATEVAGVAQALEQTAHASEANIRAHLEFLANAPRDEGSAHLAESQQYCVKQLRSMGYYATLQDAHQADEVVGHNVIGFKIGSDAKLSSEQILISAHIDSVQACRGADDNASGIAGVLETARVLAQTTHPRTLIVACWDGEERGLLGSLSYAADAAMRFQNIRTNFVFEMIGYRDTRPDTQSLPPNPIDPSADPDGYFSALFPDAYAAYVEGQRAGDFITLVYDVAGATNPLSEGSGAYADALRAHASSLGLKTIALPLNRDLISVLPDALRSDHAPFWGQGYPAIMITDTAELRNPNYHCYEGSDDPSTIDYTFATQVTEATLNAAAYALDR